MADKNQYCTGKIRIDGHTHLAKVFDDIPFAICTGAGSYRQPLLPCPHRDVDCEHCLKLMVRQKLQVTAKWVLVGVNKSVN